MSRTVSQEAVIIRLAAAARQAGTLSNLARQWRLSTPYLSDVINGRRKPGPSILKHFGLRRCSAALYERIP